MSSVEERSINWHITKLIHILNFLEIYKKNLTSGSMFLFSSPFSFSPFIHGIAEQVDYFASLQCSFIFFFFFFFFFNKYERTAATFLLNMLPSAMVPTYSLSHQAMARTKRFLKIWWIGGLARRGKEKQSVEE